AGSAHSSLVIGEADFFSPEGAPHERANLIRYRLEESPVLFVGSSLTEPDMLGYLGQSAAEHQPRFAIIFRPDLGMVDSRDADLGRRLGIDDELIMIEL